MNSYLHRTAITVSTSESYKLLLHVHVHGLLILQCVKIVKLIVDIIETVLYQQLNFIFCNRISQKFSNS